MEWRNLYASTVLSQRAYRYGMFVLAAPFLLLAAAPAVGPETPWSMHTVVGGTAGAGGFDGSDGVDLKDVNDDGLLDVTSGHEQGYRVSVSLHPGYAAVGAPWSETVALPAINLPAAEDAVFGDVDGDGAVDVIVGAEGNKPTSVLFAPTDAADLMDVSAWEWVVLPAPVEGIPNRTMRVALADITGDETPEIVVGGKEGGHSASLGYWSSPTPHIGTSWTYTEITAAGWVMQMYVQDVDGDGDLDIVYSDREPIRAGVSEEIDRTKMGVRWLENLGGTPPVWIEHPITRVENSHKWFSLVDWNGDGHEDVITCRSNERWHETSIWINGSDWLSWTEITVPVPEDVGRCQHATAVDVDGQDGLDLAFSYAEAAGLSGIVWLKNTGTPTAPTWERHEISGNQLGVKYDNLVWRDLDGDGDVDAITSEQHEDTDANMTTGPGLGVIWYENPEN